MKKIIVICIFCLFSVFLNAQIFTGVGANLLFPQESSAQRDFGGGINIYGGYCVIEKLDIGLDIQYSRFVAIVDSYSLYGLKAFAEYRFFNKSVQPFIGVGGGFFEERWKMLLDLPDYTQNGFGFSPVVGLLFNNDLMEGLKVKAELSYTYVFADTPISHYGFNVGLRYYF
ncbi:MAG: hypothetical protein PHW83_09680 [Bacteroidales bacterium]|nr:hypothetical protein [Bacteroidales bacterium]